MVRVKTELWGRRGTVTFASTRTWPKYPKTEGRRFTYTTSGRLNQSTLITIRPVGWTNFMGMISTSCIATQAGELK